MVGADKMSAIIDYTDRATCVLFGDGAGAVLLEPQPNGYGIMDTLIRSDGSGMHHLHQKAGGSRMPPTAETVAKRLHYVHQEGARGLQIRRRRAWRKSPREIMSAQQSARRHDRLAGAASGQQAHHRGDRRAHGPAAWTA